MARLVVLAAVVVLCALPAAAHAQSFSVADARMTDWNFRALGAHYFGPQGPAVAGSLVVWWREGRRRAWLMVASADAPARRILSVRKTSGILHVAAFGNRAIAQQWGTFYEVDVPTGTAKTFDPCFGDAACASCRDSTSAGNFDFELVGTVLSVGQQAANVCQSGAVHDYADGATRRFPGPVLAAAGTYAVVREATEMALFNWRTGQRLRTLGPGPFSDDYKRQVAVDERGTVVFAALTDRTTHNPFGATDQVRLAGGLLAQRRDIADDEFDEEVGARSHGMFWVSRPDASRTRRVRGQRIGGGWDFDGRRLAWATQPCMQITIQVWDLAGDPPAPASERCGVPRVRLARLKYRDTAIWFNAVCARRPARGCDGEMHAVLRRPGGGPRVDLTYGTQIHMAAGTRDRVGLYTGIPKAIRRVRGALRARFVFTSHGRRTAVIRTVRR
jgi:hypothetical protein